MKKSELRKIVREEINLVLKESKAEEQKSELKQIIGEEIKQVSNKNKITGYFVVLDKNEFRLEAIYNYNKEGKSKEIDSFPFDMNKDGSYEKAEKAAVNLARKMNRNILK